MDNAGLEAKGLDGLSADVLRPGDAGYDDARSVQNGMFDRRPAAIVRCRSDEDVVEAVDFARVNGVEISVKGGGHHNAGFAATDGGVMLDMSELDTIEIDVGARTVRAGAGLTWKRLVEATQEHGLATASGTDSGVGIAGLTLGGGLGWVMAKHGLTVDNLLAARVVTADGRVLTASADEHPDLFWALRGGGGNFGIVTEFSYRLHPIGPTVTAGFIAHPIDATSDLLRFYRDFVAKGISEDLAAWVLLVHAPDGSGLPMAALGIVHIGTEEEARRELEPLLTYGSPLMAQVGPMPYTTWLAGLGDATAKGIPHYIQTRFLRELSDEAIDTLSSSFAACPSPMGVIVLEHFHGAVARVPVEATPVPYRKVGFNFMTYGAWSDPADGDENIAWTRKTYQAMKPFFDDYVFPNYVSIDDLADPEIATKVYGPNLERLIDVKTAYDPHNLFRLNLNIVPRSA